MSSKSDKPGRVARPQPPGAPGGVGSVRIIGGLWRGRRVPIAAVPGLRPTPDRVRETLYNWLQGSLVHKRVLDLYSGTGALGLEALSRGARHATFIESDPVAAAQLRSTLQVLGAPDASVLTQDAKGFIQKPCGLNAERYGGVLMDPPFAAEDQAELCKLLDRNGWLSDDAWVYLETPSERPEPLWPERWRVWRTLTAGAVRATLIRLKPLTVGSPESPTDDT